MGWCGACMGRTPVCPACPPHPGRCERRGAGAPAGWLPLEGARLQPGAGAGAARPPPAGAFSRPQWAVAGAERPGGATHLPEPVRLVPLLRPPATAVSPWGQVFTCHLPLFPCSLPLPEPWRGVRDEELCQLTGIPGCVFVHASGFIGGNRTREGALEMARRTLAQRHGGGA